MKLFISYSRDDKQWVYEFARRLSNIRARHDVWYDQDLHVSQKWWDEILNRIEWCEAIIVILTPRYINSPFCITELKYALALNKPIMPLKMKECEIPDVLKDLEYLDIESQEMNEILIEMAAALGDIRATLGNYPPPLIKPSRLPVPTPQETVPDEPFELFTMIQQAADNDDLGRADKLAKRLKDIDPEGFGLEIDAYLNEKRVGKAGVNAYLKIVAYVESEQMHEARIAWKVYIRQYGNLNYDPKRYATMLGEIVVQKSESAIPEQGGEIADAADEDGLLDFIVKGNAASEEFGEILAKVAKEITAIGSKMSDHTKTINSLGASSATERTINIRRIASLAAADMDKFSNKVNELIPELETLTAEMTDNFTRYAIVLKENIQAKSLQAVEFRETTNDLLNATKFSLQNIIGFRMSVEGLIGNSKDLTRSGRRMTQTLDRLIAMTEQVAAFSERVLQVLDSNEE